MLTNRIKDREVILSKDDVSEEQYNLNGGKAVVGKEPIDPSQLRIKKATTKAPYIKYIYLAVHNTTTQTITHNLGSVSMVKVDVSVFGPSNRGMCNGTRTQNEGQMCVGVSEGYGGNSSIIDISLFVWSTWDWELNLSNANGTSIDLTPANSGTLPSSTGLGIIVTVYP